MSMNCLATLRLVTLSKCSRPGRRSLHALSREYTGNENFWRTLPPFKDIGTHQFLSYRWSSLHCLEGTSRNGKIQGEEKIVKFLTAVIPTEIPSSQVLKMNTRESFVADVLKAMTGSSMSIRMSPHVLSCINWNDPINDPLRRQFLPLDSEMISAHPKSKLDSLHERNDSPVEGLVHRYPTKVLFLAVSACPTYCSYCTRSYAVGAHTDLVEKVHFKPSLRRWNAAIEYIEKTPAIEDVVLSGGDAYLLEPNHLKYLGEKLLTLPNVQRIRIASKGLSVAPMRIVDPEDDWLNALVWLSDLASKNGKRISLHTHFNHPNEISWISLLAARKLEEAKVRVRNQTVLLRGVNDNFQTLSELFRVLEKMNIDMYYVYQCDAVQNAEHFRTPLKTMLELEKKLRGTIAGYLLPDFVVDLPGGGGKRLASTFISYSLETGLSTFESPAVDRNKVYQYWDPISSLGRN